MQRGVAERFGLLSYLGYVLLHPFEEETLIEEADIEVPVLAQLLAGQEAKEADAIVEVYKH